MKSKSRFTKIAVASGLIVASGAAVLGITGFASAEMAQNRPAAHSMMQAADDNSGSTDSGAADAQNAPLADDASGSVGAQSTDGQAPFGDAPDHMGGPKFMTDGLAKVLGLSLTDLQTQVKTKSLAEIAKAQNVDIQKVKDQLLKDFTEKETAEVAAGEHTQAEVDQKINDFTARLDDMVNNVRPPMGPGMGGKGGPGMGGHMGGPLGKAAADVASILGLSTSDLQTQLQTKSLADIAKAQNVDIQKVKDAIIADIKAHLDDEVKSGEHTQAEADQKLKDMTARLDDMVTKVRPAGAPDMGGKGGPGMGGHMGGRHGHGRGDGDGDGPGMGGPLGGATGNGSSAQGASFSA